MLALESQVQALDRRLKALEELPQKRPISHDGLEAYKAEARKRAAEIRPALEAMPNGAIPLKRKPGRPKKVVNG